MPSNDNVAMKFSPTGKFIHADRKIAPTKAARHTQLGKPAEITFDRDAKKLYVADGYGNRRVIVSTPTTGAYKRTGAPYGTSRMTTKQDLTIRRRRAQQFGNPVHCVKITNDVLSCLRPHQQPHPGVQKDGPS